MQCVWKFELRSGFNTPYMPRNPKPIHVGEQNGMVMLWAVVNDEVQQEECEFYVIGTGYGLPGHVRYIGTVQMQNGGCVWHVWQKIKHGPVA